MKDCDETTAVATTIDAIFQEVENCGAPCEGILLATE
jgi:hypothetical protein